MPRNYRTDPPTCDGVNVPIDTELKCKMPVAMELYQKPLSPEAKFAEEYLVIASCVAATLAGLVLVGIIVRYTLLAFHKR